MRKTHSSFTETSFEVSKLAAHVRAWLLDGEIGQLSPRTLDSRKRLLAKLEFFLTQHDYRYCGLPELREFLASVQTPRPGPNGSRGLSSTRKTNRAGTVATYWAILRTFFRFLVAEEVIEVSPMDRIKKPIDRPDQIQPFTEDQINALLAAARKSHHPRRDEALLLFLLDSGLRVSEVCSLRLRDVDHSSRRCTVQGKGDKRRDVYFSATTAKALWKYLQEETREDDSPLFLSDRGRDAGEALTKSGLFQLVRRLGKAAGVDAVRCSPHTFRHSFAVMFLRNGGNSFSLQQFLGHTSLTMTQRYVALAEADMQNQHRQFSPVEGLKRK